MPAARLALRLGDGNGGVETVGTGQPLLERVWCFVCASFDPATRRVSVHQRRQVAYARLETSATAERTVAFAPAAAEAPLLMAARLAGTDDRGRRTDRGALQRQDRQPAPVGSRSAARRGAGAAPAPVAGAPAAGPDRRLGFCAGDPDPARDRHLEHALHGETVNLPARAMTGYNWSGAEMSWSDRAARIRRDPLPRRRSLRRRLGQRLRAERARRPAQRLLCRPAVQHRDERRGLHPVLRAAAGGQADRRRSSIWRETATYLAYANHRVQLRGPAPRCWPTTWSSSTAGNSSWHEHPRARQLALRPAQRRQRHLLLLAAAAGAQHAPEGDELDGRHRLDAVALQRRHSPDRLAGGRGLRLRRHHRRGPARARAWRCCAPYRVVLTGTHPEYHSARDAATPCTPTPSAAGA